MSETILAESKNFQVTSEFESVLLHRSSQPNKPVVIGDFYGNPEGAIILSDESFVFMLGAGFILYQLSEPFQPYQYNIQSTQWIERFRESDGIWWIDKAKQEFVNTILFRANEPEKNAVIYRFWIPPCAVEQIGHPSVYVNSHAMKFFEESESK